MAHAFMIALRGYDMNQVEQVVTQAEHALASGNETARASARQALTDANFTGRLRGYARVEVDRAVEQLLDQLK
jgi:hypothetical protein